MFELPDDLLKFLSTGEHLIYDIDACECGQIILLSQDQLSLDEIYVDGESVSTDEPDLNFGNDGYYIIPAVNLVADCHGYDPPDHILTWLPDSKLFGTWDCDHYVLTVFPETSWSEIVQNPLPYVNAQWEWNNEGIPLIPWPKYPFKPKA